MGTEGQLATLGFPVDVFNYETDRNAPALLECGVICDFVERRRVELGLKQGLAILITTKGGDTLSQWRSVVVV